MGNGRHKDDKELLKSQWKKSSKENEQNGKTRKMITLLTLSNLDVENTP